MTKILIAEDNEMNMKLMFDILISQGYEAEKAVNGEDALVMLEKNDYDLLLLDLQMPVKSGYEVLAEMKNPVKTIVVSASAMETEIEKAKKLGCVDYITKPIRLNEFLMTVRNNLV